MADLIIKARQEWFPDDPEKAKGVSKKWQIIDIREDNNGGKGYGRKERWPWFIIINVALSVKEAKAIVTADGQERPWEFEFDCDKWLSPSVLDLAKKEGVLFRPKADHTKITRKENGN
jgi:hypothetical protein